MIDHYQIGSSIKTFFFYHKISPVLIKRLEHRTFHVLEFSCSPRHLGLELRSPSSSIINLASNFRTQAPPQNKSGACSARRLFIMINLRSAAALSKRLARPVCQTPSGLAACRLAATVLRLRGATVTLRRGSPTRVIAGSSPALRFPWLIECNSERNRQPGFVLPCYNRCGVCKRHLSQKAAAASVKLGSCTI